MAGNSESQPELKTISCTECRRRKAKCDKVEPCSNCSKSSRQCIYEVPVRTPLSRKRLNDVEEELAQTKRRLAQYEEVSRTGDGSEFVGMPQISSREDFVGSARASNPLSPSGRAGSHQTYSNQSPQGERLLSSVNRQQQNSVQDFMQYRVPEPVPPSAMHLSHGPKPATKRLHFEGVSDPQPPQATVQASIAASYSFYLERLHAPEGFEWDERDYKSCAAGSSDGMASLTEDNSGGYMGVASGAALLRLAGEPLSSDVSTGPSKTDMDKSRAPSPSPTITTSTSQLESFVNAYFQTYRMLYRS
jgi:transcriptional regulatory protein GAL4